MAVTKYTAKVEQAIKDATAVLAILETALTLAYDCNKEVDYVTDGMTDFLDAASATQKVSTQEAEAIKTVKTETDQNSE